MAEDEDDERPGELAPVSGRGQPSAFAPLVTSPMTVELAPRYGGGAPAAASGLNFALRKNGVRRTLSILRRINQPEGFACPGCAWPSPADPRRFEVCENGARAAADEATLRRADARLFATYTVAELALRSDRWLGDQGRLCRPMILRAGRATYEPIAWEEALDLVAAELGALDDPRRAVFYSSGHGSNEAAFAWQALARALGTNNLPSARNLCHDTGALALEQALGQGHGCVTLADFEEAEAIFVIGHNTASTSPRMLGSLRAARARGARIVVVNPLLEPGLVRFKAIARPREWLGAGAEIADLYLRVRVGGDLALLRALAKVLVEEEADALDRAFLDRHGEGFEALEAALSGVGLAELVEASGAGESEVREAARIFAASKATIICWGTGLTQHRDGVAKVRAALDLLLLAGQIGKPGAGACPMAGHSNAEGQRRMGVDPRPGAAWLAALAALEPLAGRRLPREPGWSVVEALRAAAAGEVEVLMTLGGNLLSAAPATADTAAALQRPRLSVHIATKLNRSHLVTGRTALLLPCLARGERGQGTLSVVDAHQTLVPTRGDRRPIDPQLRAELDIVCSIAARLFPDRAEAWTAWGESPQRVRQAIAEVAPGFPAVAHGSRSWQGGARERVFATASGRAQLSATMPATPLPRRHDQLWLTTLRAHDQHNSTIYEAGDRLRGVRGYRRLVMMSLADLRRLEIEPYEQVDLSTVDAEGHERRADRWVVVPHDIAPGCLAAYFPEANALVPTSWHGEELAAPGYKSLLVRVHRAAAGEPLRERGEIPPEAAPRPSTPPSDPSSDPPSDEDEPDA